MSTLTKVLIVLLTISSIFLCGIVVTYVANADNYRQQYTQRNSELLAAKESERDAIEKRNNIEKEMTQQKQDLDNEIASLTEQIQGLKGDITNAEIAKDDALRRVNNWASITKDFYETNDKQGQLLKNTLDELNKVQTELIQERKDLKETTTALIEKMAIIAQLDGKSKQLLEEKTELQDKLDQFLQQYGKAVVAPVPVTPTRDRAQVARATRDIDLKGLVTAVDLKHSLVEVSIGDADGVREDMTFHVTRGDKFICNIVILDVEPEKAVGFLDLVKDQPMAGDNISTNL